MTSLMAYREFPVEPTLKLKKFRDGRHFGTRFLMCCRPVLIPNYANCVGLISFMGARCSYGNN